MGMENQEVGQNQKRGDVQFFGQKRKEDMAAGRSGKEYSPADAHAPSAERIPLVERRNVPIAEARTLQRGDAREFGAEHKEGLRRYMAERPAAAEPGESAHEQPAEFLPRKPTFGEKLRAFLNI